MGQPERSVSWTAGDIFLALALFIPLWLVAAITLYVTAEIILAILFQPSPKSLVLLVIGVSAFIADVGMVWWIAIHRRKASWADIGLNGINIWLDFPLAVAGQVTAFIGLVAYAVALNTGFGEEMPTQLKASDFGLSTAGFISAIIIVAVLAPIGEEIFFRGFIYQGLKKRLGMVASMIVTSAIFALFHIHYLFYVPMFTLGMVMVVLYEYRKTLAPNIIMHALNNLVALLIVYGSLN